MKKQMNKNGSIMVFLTSILITMIMVSMVFVHAARSVCGASYSDAVFELAGRSVLAEFDRRLKDEYGLFAYYGFEDRVESSFWFYASGSFKKKYPGESGVRIGMMTDLFRLKLQHVNAKLAAYSLMDVDVLEDQIDGYMNYLFAEKGLQFIIEMGSKGSKEAPDSKGEERELKNQAEINSLPSSGNVSNGIDISAITAAIMSSDEFINKFTRNFKVNEYIMSHFKYSVGGGKEKETMFRNEVEYILYGKMKDKDNQSRFRTDFFIIRSALNVFHIVNSQEKSEAVKALAALFSPAPWVWVAIIGAWGAAEAENDARRLLAGEKVPLFKDDSEWALGLDMAINVMCIYDDEGEITNVEATSKSINGYISPRSDAGLSYADYLRLFLFFEKRETKLLRTMDLIQLNLRGTYYKDFLVKNHYTGFSLTAVVSGRTFEYAQKY